MPIKETVLVRNFASIPDLLNAVVAGEIEAAVLPRIPAINFVGDLYRGKLHIVGEPLTDEGLHVIALKGKMGSLNRHLESLAKRGDLKKLQEKWQLIPK